MCYLLQVFGGLSASEFMNRFNAWKVTLANKIEANAFASSKNLLLIMKVNNLTLF